MLNWNKTTPASSAPLPPMQFVKSAAMQPGMPSMPYPTNPSIGPIANSADAALQDNSLPYKINTLTQVEGMLKRKLERLEEKLEAARLKRSKILDELLTLEGYWTGPPSSHECSAESGDELQEAEMLQRRSAMKLKGKGPVGGPMVPGRIDLPPAPVMASPGSQHLTPHKMPAVSVGRVGAMSVSPVGAGKVAMPLAAQGSMAPPPPPPGAMVLPAPAQEFSVAGSQQLLSEDAAIIAMLSKATHPSS